MKLDVKFGNILEIFNSKQVRYGGYAAVIIVVVLAALVVLNVLVGQIPASFDMTQNKLYSLSPETKKLVQGLKDDVTIYALYRTGQENQGVVEVLKKYQRLSDKLQVKYVDPDQNPGLISKYSTNGQTIAAGSLIVASGNYDKVLGPYDLYDISYTQQGQPQILGFTMEQKVTAAIQYVSSGYTPKIYEITNHGEDTLASIGLDDTLSKGNYDTADINLLQDPAVPKDASVLIDISPKYDLNKVEEQKILDYINNGGRAMLFFDYSNKELTNYQDLLSSYGVGLDDGVVMEGDQNHFAMNNPLLLVPNNADTKILNTVSDNKLSMFLVNAIGIKQLPVVKRDLKISPLLTTSDNSWVRTDLTNGSRNRIASDLKGPINLAVTIEQQTDNPDTNPGYRVVVVGDAQFLGGIPLIGQIKGNVEFFLDALQWAANRPNTVNVSSKSLFKLPLQMSNVITFLYMGIVIILIPLVILAIGLTIWLRRRHL
jgi:gliding motility-associatede transport system auxiliary component